MKNVILCGINARYTHSNLALQCLKYAAGNKSHILEFSINDSVSRIVGGIVRGRPDAVGFSCYIWNIEHVLKTASTVKKILPQCFVFLGGPEVSHNSAGIMQKHAFIDMIIKGQGETPFSQWMGSFENGHDIGTTPSACIRFGGQITETADAPPYDLSHRPFMYEDLGAYENRTIYYETSRGCPYCCAYCMSANVPMSYVPLDRVKEELAYFIQAGVRQVKLVDRSFNYPPGRAYEILQTIIALSEKYPQSHTNFHLEISACLLDGPTVALIKTARDGLIQLEIGIQSTNPDTLKAVGRAHDTQKLLDNTRKLCGLQNIHVHADLIAGLPCESYDTFKASFNDAYRLNADTLQLGFLKMLRGAPLYNMAGRYGIVYTEYAPYEVLSTHAISYQELSTLHLIAHVLDSLYNTGHCKKTLAYLLPAYESPFSFFEQFALCLDKCGYFIKPQKKQIIFEALYQFAAGSQNVDLESVREALIFDWLCLEKPRVWPKGLEVSHMETDKMQIRRFFKDKGNIQKYLPAYQSLSPAETEKRCFMCVFDFIFPGQTAMLFDYGKKPGDRKFYQIIEPLK
ncbi:MAG: B12-binding domain-containing radical SAM protein [Eubacteriales bacterium]|nr:B12-binding domain-containing radical SAM protein [Eubacteriales bacterium]